jgi:energy-coupling factor transporter ATP-binding protein EcfA2
VLHKRGVNCELGIKHKMINIKIENSRNVAKAEISLIPNELNIRYAMNGTGKTTIAKTLEYISKGIDLADLKTFGEDALPTCSTSIPIKKVLTFDESFVSTIVFQESEVIKDAFEVFLKTPEYEEKLKNVNDRLKEIHIDTTHADFANLLNTGNSVLSKFTKTAKGLKNVGLIKSLTSSESIFVLPEKLKKFQPLMDKDYNVDWVGWKSDGVKFDDNQICPFCTATLEESYTEEKQIFSESYTKSNVKNIREMLGYFDSLQDYMHPDKRESMSKCIKECTDEATITKWVTDFYNDLDFLINKIQKVVNFNAYHVNQDQISDLANQLNELSIASDTLAIFNGEKTINLINELNKKIKIVALEVENLKKEIGTLKGFINGCLEKAVTDINEFLDMASVDYALEIRHLSDKDTKTLLKYKCSEKNHVVVDNIKKSLSWGERNAFALVLFMHYTLSQEPDLIILDDPISSFYSNKKYAIINRLFKNHKSKKSLYKKTALLLTHDFQPVIDFIVNSKPNGGNTNAAFLRNDLGQISETEIKDSDINSFAILLKENSINEGLNKIHRITSLRKLIEHTQSDDKSKLAYNLLSCLLHAKEIPTFLDETPMTSNDIADAESFIQQYISDFNYSKYFKNVFTKSELINLYASEKVDYYKLQTFRIIIEFYDIRSKISDPILKYIDEQFHIKNDYVFYLDYSKYNTVPSFIIPKCTEYLIKENFISA